MRITDLFTADEMLEFLIENKRSGIKASQLGERIFAKKTPEMETLILAFCELFSCPVGETGFYFSIIDALMEYHQKQKVKQNDATF